MQKVLVANRKCTPIVPHMEHLMKSHAHHLQCENLHPPPEAAIKRIEPQYTDGRMLLNIQRPCFSHHFHLCVGAIRHAGCSRCGFHSERVLSGAKNCAFADPSYSPAPVMHRQNAIHDTESLGTNRGVFDRVLKHGQARAAKDDSNGE